MWKLVKTELMYVNGRLSIAMLAAIVLLTSLLVISMSGGNGNIFIDIGTAIIYIIYIARQIQLKVCEDKEKRIRLICTMPVPKWKVALARIVNPTVILLVFTLVNIVYILIVYYFVYERLLYFTEALPLWIFVTFLMRLSSEKNGKILGMCFIVVLFLGAGALGSNFDGLTYILVLFAFAVTNIWAAVGGALVISGFLWGAFMLRRSYLK